MFDFLKGKKTYICMALGAVVVVLHFFGVFNEDLARSLLELLGFAGVASLRSSIRK